MKMKNKILIAVAATMLVLIVNVIIMFVAYSNYIQPLYLRTTEQHLEILRSTFYLHYRLGDINAAECSFRAYHEFAEVLDNAGDKDQRIQIRKDLGIDYMRMALLSEGAGREQAAKEYLTKSMLEFRMAGEKPKLEDVRSYIRTYEDKTVFVCKDPE